MIGFAPAGTQSPHPGQPKVMGLTALGEIVFEKTFWCGTCALLFSRVPGADRYVTPHVLRGRLKTGLDALAPDVTAAFLSILTPGRYLPLLLEVTPVLVSPGDDLDYFTHEQLQTWASMTISTAPRRRHAPITTGSTARACTGSTGNDLLFEFLVPIFSPEHNNPATIDGVRHCARKRNHPDCRRGPDPAEHRP